MAKEIERVRQEIASTRADLARDVDRLAHETAPGRLTGRLTRGLRSLKNRTIGTSERAAATVTATASDAVDRLHSAGEGVADRLHSAGESVADRLHSAGESAAGVLHDAGTSLQQAPRKVAQATQGSPIGVGLIAFGTGMLAAALVPETEAERRAAQQVAEHVGPVVAPLQEAGRALASDIGDTVAAAGGEVRTAAADAATHVQAVARQGAHEVGASAAAGAADVRTAAADALHETSDRAHTIAEQVRRDS
jgi:hypothetical protein